MAFAGSDHKLLIGDIKPMQYVELRQPTDIETLLVWTYRDQKADRVISVGTKLHRQEAEVDGEWHDSTSKDGIAAVERAGILGTRIDGGGNGTAALHGDAEYVHEAVMTLPMPVAMLTMQHARAASRPDGITIPIPRPVRQLAQNGRVKLVYAAWDKSHNYGLCPLAWTSSPVTVDALAAEYGLWRLSLTILALALSGDGRLTRHRATKPIAPVRPRVRFAAA
jgi:hypothetical protein